MHAGKPYRKTVTQSGELNILKVWAEAKNNGVTLGCQPWGPRIPGLEIPPRHGCSAAGEFAGPRGRLATFPVWCYLEEPIYRNWPGSEVGGQALGIRSGGGGVGENVCVSYGSSQNTGFRIRWLQVSTDTAGHLVEDVTHTASAL